MKINTLALALVLLAAPFAVSAEEATHPMNHDDMQMEGMPMEGMAKHGAEDATPATKAFKAADAAMMKDMAIDYSGNVDVDFVRGMIPHHQGAIAMAKIELQYGKDPEIRKLAEGIIKAQDDEIAFMKAWLAKNGGAASKNGGAAK
ncbi:protein of unknown function [Kaistia soli DSM 19436]|uniref:DUF305 domain-containing protein n=1 Tax=Kaistia soli DSM 19436 TaxID=1122133 RepID=A0A1M5DM57_9HYPH|nr:protein of unknown function [Kaistia soli DSM 19436]